MFSFPITNSENEYRKSWLAIFYFQSEYIQKFAKLDLTHANKLSIAISVSSILVLQRVWKSQYQGWSSQPFLLQPKWLQAKLRLKT